MAKLELDRLAKAYDGQPVVREVSLAVEQGEFLSLLGPSGCGKTTILRMVAGLIEPSGGRIRIAGAEVTSLPPNRRDIGLVFQSYALFPHMTVSENVAFGLRRRAVAGRELDRRVEEALRLVRLQGFGDRHPRQLSGGQQQRVALARSIAPRPQLLLLDEPLSNLDAQLRDEMQIELKRLQRELGITSVFVTHDQGEALSLSDRVCILDQGRVQQLGTPEDVYHRPANLFVAGFIGRSNRLSGRIVAPSDGDGRDGLTTVELAGGLRLSAAANGVQPGAQADVIIRHEALRFAGAASAGVNTLHGRINLRSFVGARVQYVVALADGLEIVAETPTATDAAGQQVGAPVTLQVDPEAVFILPAGAGGAA